MVPLPGPAPESWEGRMSLHPDLSVDAKRTAAQGTVHVRLTWEPVRAEQARNRSGGVLRRGGTAGTAMAALQDAPQGAEQLD